MKNLQDLQGHQELAASGQVVVSTQFCHLIQLNASFPLPIRPRNRCPLLLAQDLYKYLPFKLFSNYRFEHAVSRQGAWRDTLPLHLDSTLLILFLYINMRSYLSSRKFPIYNKIKAHLNNTYLSREPLWFPGFTGLIIRCLSGWDSNL